jgi:hypothetical protein
MLSEIAGRTGNYKIVDTVSGNIRASNTREWECVINVMLPPFYLVLTVIAFLALAQVLLMKLLAGMRS